MFDFGDEVTIESYRIPWLIWIQLLAMLLLMLLFYCFVTLFDLDLPGGTSSSASSSLLCPQSQLDQKPAVFKRKVSACFQASQVGEKRSIKGEIATGTSRRIVVRGEDGVEQEGCSAAANQNCYHPCHYLRLAKLALLKCLGLDSLFENNGSTSERRNQR